MISSMLDPRHKHLAFLTPTQRLAANAKLVELGEAVETGQAAFPQATGDEAALSESDEGTENTRAAATHASAMALTSWVYQSHLACVLMHLVRLCF